MIEIVTSQMIVEKRHSLSDYFQQVKPEIAEEEDDWTVRISEEDADYKETSYSTDADSEAISFAKTTTYKQDDNHKWGKSYSEFGRGWPRKDQEEMR